MRFRTAALFVLLALPLGVHAAVAEVQAKQGAVSASSTTLAFTSNNTSGNFIAVGIECNTSGSAPTLAVSDSRNTYSSAIAVHGNTGIAFTQIFYAANIGAGANTVSVSSSVNVCSYINLVIVEYSGVVTTSPEDGSGAAASGGSTSLASGNYTVTIGDLLIGFGATAGGSIAHGTGFTSRGTDTFSMLEDNVSAGSTTANATFTGTSGIWVSQGVAFKAAAAPAVTQGQQSFAVQP